MYYRIARLFLLVLSFPLLAEPLPEWVSSPPQKTASELYGVGTGNDFIQAKNSAIAAIGGIFSSSVSEHFAHAQELKNADFKQLVQITTMVKTENVAINSIDVVKSRQVKDVFFVLVKMDLEKFANTARKTINVNEQRFQSWFRRMSNMPYLSLVSQRQAILKQIQTSQQLLLQLGYADPSTDVLADFQKTILFQQKLTQYFDSNAVKFSFSMTEPSVLNEVKAALTQFGVNLELSENATVSTHIDLSSGLDYQVDKRGAYNANLLVTLTTTENGVEVGKAIYSARGRSYENKQTALTRCLSNLRFNLKQDALEDILNLSRATN